MCLHFFSYKELSKKEIFDFLKGYVLFTIFSSKALGANFISHAIYLLTKLHLCYLHPTSRATFPIIDTLIKPFVPFLVYYLVYLITLFLITFVPVIIFYLIEEVRLLIKKKEKKKFHKLKFDSKIKARQKLGLN